MENLIVDLAEFAVNHVFGTSFFDSVKNSVNIDLTTGSSYAAMWQTAGMLYEKVFIPLGIGLLLIFFVLGLTERMSENTDSFEQMMKEFLKFILAVSITQKGWSILTYAVSLGYGLLNDVSSLITGAGSGSSGELLTLLTDTIKDNSVIENLGILVPLLILWLAGLIIQGLVLITCYSRTITICLMAAIFPICLPDIYQRGTSGNGFRYFKSFLAVCMQGAIILVIAYLVSVCSAASVMNLSTDMGLWYLLAAVVPPLAIQVAGVSMMMKSLQYVKDVIGA